MSTAINITSCFRDPQSSLIFAFQQKNLQDFKYALENMKADPNVLDKSNEMSIFQSILQTSKSSAFIKLCIENDGDCYIKNSITNKYPLHYVIESQCPENLNAFLRNYNPSQINVKYYHKNSLHILMDMLTVDNYDNISECFKICLINGCDPNLANEKSRTPFFMLLKKQKELKDKNELIDFCLLNATIDVYTYKSAEMIKMMESQNKVLPEKSTHSIDADFMLSLLRARKQTEFESNFKAFKETSTSKQIKKEHDENVDNNFMEHCSSFLEVAVNCGLANIVELLISNDVDVNKSRVDGGNNVNPPAFRACSYGYSDILELLLKKPELKFQRDMSVRRTLLHEVCMHLGTQERDALKCSYLKCFNLLIDDPRCDINAQDYQGNTALHYAVRNKSDVATMALLKKSAYIGTQNMFKEIAIDEINSNVLGRFLDDCITTNTQRMGDEEHEINIDYTFLMAPKVRNVALNEVTENTFAEEIAPLSYIAKSSDLRPLIKHPVLSSYLYLKWQKLSFLFYTNLLVFSIFLVSFITYIVLCQSIEEENKKDSGAYSFFYNVSFLGIIILTLREIFQCFLSFKHYFLDPVNWFEIVLICLAWIVLLGSNLPEESTRILRAVTILFVATEFLQLVGTLPILSVSTHMVILKKVSVTFLKSIALYSILLFAFALCFYTMFGGTPKSNNNGTETASPSTDNGCKTNNDDADADEFNNFGYPGIAIIKTFVMLTGEFDASSLDLNNASYCIIFVMFVFLITIVLFNLLNALAISDTQIIKNDAELTDLTQRIAVLACYERIIFTNSSRSFCASIPFATKWLKSVISIFPHTILCRIVIRPNQNNAILTPMPNKPTNEKTVGDEELQVLNNNNTLQRLKKQMPMEFKMQRYSTMDAKIMKKIKIVMDECNERIEKEMKEEKLSQQIQSMEKQLKMLTDLFIAQNKIKH